MVLMSRAVQFVAIYRSNVNKLSSLIRNEKNALFIIMCVNVERRIFHCISHFVDTLNYTYKCDNNNSMQK